jgi:hypothetical protein
MLADNQRSIPIEGSSEHDRVQAEQHDRARWGASAKPAHNRANVQIRHLRVQQHDIWVKCLSVTNRFGRVIRLGEHAQVRLEQQTSNQGPPDERRVFDEQ